MATYWRSENLTICEAYLYTRKNLHLGKSSKLLLTIDLPQHFVLSVLDGKIYRRNVNFRSNQDELTFLIILLESLLGGSAYGMPILRKD